MEILRILFLALGALIQLSGSIEEGTCACK